MVGMANSGPNSNGCQFFITYSAQPTLDGKHTILGEVLAGMEVAEKLMVRDPATDSESLPPADQILSVTIEESSG
jgi:cyclophilin family peptidyl-prolyl cis-trans isomerase